MCNKIPARYVLVMMVFFGTWTSYTLRTNISIAIIAMTEQQLSLLERINCGKSDHNHHNSVVKYSEKSSSEHRDDLHKWSNKQQGHVLGAYFVGYVLTSIPGRWLSRRFGSRWLVGVTTLVSGATTILMPIFANYSLLLIIAGRGLIGLTAGFMFPGMHTCILLWAPPEERKKFVWGLLGGTLGAILNWPLCALVIRYMSWEMIFYISGALAIAWSILWMILIYDSPAKHPRITNEEKLYITTKIGFSELPTVEKKVPWGEVLKSSPTLCLLFLHFCHIWNVNFLLVEGPAYMIKLLGYLYVLGSVLASIPYFIRLIMGFLFGAIINHIILGHDLMCVINTRRVFTILSHCIPGILLIVISNSDCGRTMIVVLLTVSVALNGAAVGGVLANIYDLTPNHAGKLFNMVNNISMISGFLVAELVGILTTVMEPITGWQLTIMINGCLYLLSAFLFLIFASDNVQPWDDLE